MTIARTFVLAATLSSVHGFQRPSLAQYGAQASPAVVTTIDSPAEALRTPNTALRIVVRDADGPDQPIGQAYVVVSRVDSASKNDYPQRGISSNDRGLLTVRLTAGDYTVSVRRVQFHEARFTIHVRSNCEQILEVYITHALYPFDRCQVTTGTNPPCDPGPPPTLSRAILTTCAHSP